ncbi:MAG: hypothetical protein MZV63_03510 [Marinilabiliales bacterium]|nr:hypothetical protein [Marinilabiliales bacterium]
MDPIPLPKVVRVKQRFDRPRVEDPEAELTRLLREKGISSLVRKGMSIAVTVGSRGFQTSP